MTTLVSFWFEHFVEGLEAEPVVEVAFSVVDFRIFSMMGPRSAPGLLISSRSLDATQGSILDRSKDSRSRAFRASLRLRLPLEGSAVSAAGTATVRERSFL